MTEEDRVLADVEGAITSLIQDQRDVLAAGKQRKTATEIWAHTFSALSTQHVAADDGLDARALFRQIAFNSATIAILVRRLMAAEAELAAVKGIYNLP
jgi:hypothetical protein